eukprot:TRINITY_DN68046_c7_g2_i2.p1 TRINITY_DN68046_c7_g2~~TRINITY_DN68046_c7_g2_i2.p1  ORF type:complete len:883 (+),score=52.31 TRINITY_DN68046_c7_g2_i2:88-2736(+)
MSDDELTVEAHLRRLSEARRTSHVSHHSTHSRFSGGDSSPSPTPSLPGLERNLTDEEEENVVLTKQERAICETAFDESRTTGLNSHVRIRAMLAHLGQPISDAELTRMLERVDWKGEGHLLSFDALVHLLELQKEKYVYVEEGRDASAVEAFIALAGHKNGNVATDFLKSSLEGFELTFDIDGMLELVDGDSDGTLDFDEFYRIFGTHDKRLLEKQASEKFMDAEEEVNEDKVNSLKAKVRTTRRSSRIDMHSKHTMKRSPAQPRALGEKEKKTENLNESEHAALKGILTRIQQKATARKGGELLTHEERIALFIQKLQVDKQGLQSLLDNRVGERVLSSSRQLTHGKTYTPKRYINAAGLKKQAGVGEHQFRMSGEHKNSSADVAPEETQANVIPFSSKRERKHRKPATVPKCFVCEDGTFSDHPGLASARSSPPNGRRSGGGTIASYAHAHGGHSLLVERPGSAPLVSTLHGNTPRLQKKVLSRPNSAAAPRRGGGAASSFVDDSLHGIPETALNSLKKNIGQVGTSLQLATMSAAQVAHTPPNGTGPLASAQIAAQAARNSRPSSAATVRPTSATPSTSTFGTAPSRPSSALASRKMMPLAAPPVAAPYPTSQALGSSPLRKRRPISAPPVAMGSPATQAPAPSSQAPTFSTPPPPGFQTPPPVYQPPVAQHQNARSQSLASTFTPAALSHKFNYSSPQEGAAAARGATTDPSSGYEYTRTTQATASTFAPAPRQRPRSAFSRRFSPKKDDPPSRPRSAASSGVGSNSSQWYAPMGKKGAMLVLNTENPFAPPKTTRTPPQHTFGSKYQAQPDTSPYYDSHCSSPVHNASNNYHQSMLLGLKCNPQAYAAEMARVAAEMEATNPPPVEVEDGTVDPFYA